MSIAATKKHELNIPQLLISWELRSLELIRKYAKKPDIVIQRYKPEFPVHGHWMTMASLNATAFKISFKVFFKSADCASFCSAIYKKSSQQIIPEQLFDFTKEFCNQSIGWIKHDFERINVACSTSLPIALRSFDNLFFVKNANNLEYEDFWSFRLRSSELICCICLDIFDPVAFQNYNIASEPKVNSGKFEIL